MIGPGVTASTLIFSGPYWAREHPCHAQHTRLAYRVVDGAVDAAGAGDNRRDVDNSAAALAAKRRQHGLGNEEYRLQIDIHDPIPLRLIEGLGLRRIGDAGIVHENVDPTERCSGLSDQSSDRADLQ